MRSRIITASVLPILGALIPMVASAATLTDTLVFMSTFLNGVIGLFITLAIVVFFWGLIKYLWSMGTEDAHEGLKIMFWGIIAIFVMVSIWGIIRLLQSTLKVTSTDPVIPKGVVVNPGVYQQGNTY
ncbi:hypothetical protein A3A40_01280 [Candidatus Kaiserbacteria bacterium RIFCSPLOWO2_01_FULL_54_20]|uniref:Uncharacterized protein n=1 Tax=Candidatus Kaiserbacteria bacterium RIFCSPLOWO2_01_FULL_54_20 TaxID=1798513 RepID=A0A1F6EJW8_9BACT|nr:MAG: hypothetical protein A3A40_01280 [Candidatus Kaiserbacteria bacterium RIFCSPLOWO2_01_FULL_54_20]